MYKILLCAGLLMISFIRISAQHTDEILSNNEPAFIRGVDEKFIPENPRSKIAAPDLLKSLPLLEGKNVSLETVLKGKRRGSIFVQEGKQEIVATGFKKNRLHGAWSSRYDNGVLLDSGNFKNNIPDGVWRSWYPGGQLRSVRTYNADKWFAVHSEINRNNSRIYFYQLSSMMAFRNRNFESFSNATSSFSSLPAEKMKYHPPFKYCLHHGLFMNFYPNGALKDSGYYKDGLKDGLWNEYFNNGQLGAQGSYFHGVKHGGWKYLNREGKLVMLAEFHHGKLSYKKVYNSHP
jgi:antitoxin component YwqK of YwqJK toxin-antitoxin module